MTKKEFSKDCYVRNQELFTRYRTFQTEEGEVIDFNHASLARPYHEVFEALQANEKQISSLEARIVAGSFVGIDDPAKVIFGRNTTEALSFTYWLAEVEKGNVVVTDAENESVARIYRQHRDHGNTNKKDGWSTFPDDIVAEDYQGLEDKIETNVPVKTAQFLGKYNIDSILDSIDQDTRLVVVSHIVRNDGRIINVKELARKVKEKNPNTYVAIDGAQALGNIASIDFNELEEAGVDFYVATPHKTLGSYPLGVLYVSERAKKNIQLLREKKPIEQIIMQGMVPDEYGIVTNIESELNGNRYASIVAAAKTLQEQGFRDGNDFTRKTNYIRDLKHYFIKHLQNYETEIISEGNEYSLAIVSFRFKDRDNAGLVQKLQEEGVFCSYISETDNIRVSFDITNTKKEIDMYFGRMSPKKTS